MDQQTNVKDRVAQFSSLWKSRVKHGGERGDKRSLMYPVMKAALDSFSNAAGNSSTNGSANKRKEPTASEFIRENWHLLSSIVESPGRAIFGLGLTYDEIDELASVFGMDSDDLCENADDVIIILYPALNESDDIRKAFGKKLKSLLISSKIGGSILSSLAVLGSKKKQL